MARAWQPERAAIARSARCSRLVTSLAAAVAAATVVTGLAMHWGNGGLGTATPPFVAGWAPSVHPLALVSVGVAAAVVWVAPRLLSVAVPPAAFVPAAFGLSLALGLSVNLARHGIADWTRVFDTGPHGSWEAQNEYLPGLPALSYGVRFYLDRFAELVPAEPVNIAGHPPGPLLLIRVLGITTPGRLAALCIGVGALSAPLTYVLARTLRDDAAGRRAALLCASSPLTVLFGVTSMDYLYMSLGVAAACLLAAPRRRHRAVGTGVLAVAALFSWALLAIGAWATLVVAQREGVRRAVWLAAGCAVSIVVLNATLAAVYGYDPVGTLQATAGVYRHSLASIRPYAFWLFGSPVAWALVLGLPIIRPALIAAARRDPAALALAIVIAIAALGGYTKAETERIWLYLVPLACVAAATGDQVRRPIRTSLTILIVQVIAIELLFDTVW